MPAPLMSKTEVVDRLASVFRVHGFEGTSIRLLSQRTGLGRASLYHYFPGGKEEMAAAVVDRAGELLEELILGPLYAPGTPVERLQNMSDNLHAYYDGGSLPYCLIDTLSVGDSPIKSAIKTATESWLEGFAHIARDAGFSDTEARDWADDALGAIEGSLVLSRSTNDPEIFIRALERLNARLRKETGAGTAAAE